MKYVQLGILFCLAAIVGLLGALYLQHRTPAPNVETAMEQPLAAPDQEAPASPQAVEPLASEAKPTPATAKPAPEKPAPKPAAPALVEPPAAPKIVETPKPVETAQADPLLPEERLRAEEPPPVEPPAPRTVTMPNGQPIVVRLNHTLSTERNRAGDEFQSVLDAPLVVDGLVIAEKGSVVKGRVVESDRAGRVKGLAFMSLELTSLATRDGQIVPIATQAIEQDGPKTVKKDAAKVGIGAGVGAAIGAVIGGGKGAAVGAATGGGAAAGTVAATRGEPVVMPVETRLEFRLNRPVTITEHP